MSLTHARLPDLRNARFRMSLAEVIYLHRKNIQPVNNAPIGKRNPRRLRDDINGPVPVLLESVGEQVRDDLLDSARADCPRMLQ